MELQQLKYFKAVAATGKISYTAEALFISAPALSTSISRLEKELGVKLFDRTSNRITLNAQGNIFLSQHPGYNVHPDIRYIPLVDSFSPLNARLYWRQERPLTDEEATFRDFALQLYKNLH